MVEPQQPPSYYQPAPSPQPERRSRTWLWVLLGGGLLGLLLIAGGIGLAVMRGFQGQSNIPALLGADTQLYATITPNLSALPGVARLQEAYPDLFVEQDSSNADEQLEELLGVNFKEDVQPWIGTEMAIAVSGLKDFTLEGGSLAGGSAEELARQAQVTIVLASRDRAAAEAFLEKQRAHRSDDGQSFEEMSYERTTIYEQSDAENSPIAAFAMVRDYVVFASTAEVIKGMLDRSPGGDDSLERNPRFISIRDNLPKTAVGYLFVDGQALSSVTTAAIEQSLDALPPSQAEQLEDQIKNVQALQGIGASISVVEQGVQFDTAVTFDMAKLDERITEQITENRNPVPVERLQTISRDAVGLVTFRIPSTFKTDILNAINAQENGEETLQQFEDEYGFNLEKDFLDWFSGDASLVVLPGGEMGEVTLPATAYFAIKPSDKGAAEDGMAKIAAAVEKLAGGSEGGFEFTSEDIAGQEWQAVKEPESEEPMVGYSFIGDDLVVAVGNTALNGASDGNKTPITDNETFKTLLAQLPNPNGGVFFVNIENALDLSREAGTLPEDFDDQYIKPIKALGAAGEPGVTEAGIAKSRFFINIE